MHWVFVCLLGSGILAAAGPEENRARDLYNRADYRQSLDVLLEHTQRPQDAATLQLIGQDYFMLGEYKKSTDALEKAALLDRNNAEVLHWLGRAYGRRAETGNPFTAPGHASKSRQMFERSVEIDPSNKEAVNDLFDFYMQAPGFLGGGMHKAEALVALIAKMDPAEGHYAEAQLADKRKEFDKAERHLRHAMELAPRQVGRVMDLAKYLAKHGRVSESEALFEHATRLAPGSPQVLYGRAETYVEQKRNLEQARRLLEQYVRAPLTPEDPPRQQAEELLKKIG